jgi:hypothetical protein
MRFVGALDAILALAVAWKLLGHFENTSWHKTYQGLGALAGCARRRRPVNCYSKAFHSFSLDSCG